MTFYLRAYGFLWSNTPEGVLTVRHLFCPLLQKREIEYTSAVPHPIVGQLKLDKFKRSLVTPIGVYPWRRVLRIFSQLLAHSLFACDWVAPNIPRITVRCTQNNFTTKCFKGEKIRRYSRDVLRTVAHGFDHAVSTRPIPVGHLLVGVTL